MDYFAANGYECFAPCLRGSSGSPPPSGENENGKIQVGDHIRDLRAFIDEVVVARGRKSNANRRLVLVGHSMGGLVSMKLCETEAQRFSGVALMCSVPPAGNSQMTIRFIFQRGLIVFVNIFRGFILQEVRRNPRLNQILYLPHRTNRPEQDPYLVRFTEQVDRDYRYVLDVSDLNQRCLPIRAVNPKSGQAQWLHPGMSTLVVGAEKDYIVDQTAVEETATFLGTSPVTAPGQTHDLMLRDDWEVGATILLNWLSTI